jgi:hypothetical protein
MQFPCLLVSEQEPHWTCGPSRRHGLYCPNEEWLTNSEKLKIVKSLLASFMNYAPYYPLDYQVDLELLCVRCFGIYDFHKKRTECIDQNRDVPKLTDAEVDQLFQQTAVLGDQWCLDCKYHGWREINFYLWAKDRFPELQEIRIVI